MEVGDWGMIYVVRWLVLCVIYFFFFKQKAACEFFSSVGGSDVCSSDLLIFQPDGGLI